MNRVNWALAALLIIQLGLAAWLLRPQTTAQAAQPLLPAVSAGQITKVKVADGADSVELAKAGENWVVPAAGNFPVREPAVTKLISDVLAIDTGRLVANSPTAQARLKVAPTDFMRRIELETSGGQHYQLYVGTSPTANATHVRLDGQNAVYLAPGAIAGDAAGDLAGWVDTAYVKANPAAVTAVEVVNAGGAFTVTRTADGGWTMAGLQPGETVNRQVVDALVQQVAGLNLVKPLGTSAKPEYGLDAPAATVSLTLSPTVPLTTGSAAAQTITLDVGKLDTAANTYVVKSSASPYYVTAAKFALQDLVDKRRKDFVGAALAPAAAPPGLGQAGILTPTTSLTATGGLTATVTPTITR